MGSEGEFLDGAIDEFYIFTSALMHAEVEALMKKCEFPGDSEYNFVDITIQGLFLLSKGRGGGNSHQFSGYHFM